MKKTFVLYCTAFKRFSGIGLCIIVLMTAVHIAVIARSGMGEITTRQLFIPRGENVNIEPGTRTCISIGEYRGPYEPLFRACLTLYKSRFFMLSTVFILYAVEDRKRRTLDMLLALPVRRITIPAASILSILTWAALIEIAGIAVTTRPLLGVIKHTLMTLDIIDPAALHIDDLKYAIQEPVQHHALTLELGLYGEVLHRTFTDRHIWIRTIHGLTSFMLYLGIASFTEGLASLFDRRKNLVRLLAMAVALTAYFIVINNHYMALPSGTADLLPLIAGTVFMINSAVLFHFRGSI